MNTKNIESIKHASLFSGMGGPDLAAEWMGWENVLHCEWNEFGQRVLKYYWPNAISYGDITKTDFTIHRGTIDVLTGGFPCQPYSVAGKQKGKEDERHLWPEMLRAIREIAPSYVVGENVRGLVSWNGGLVFDEVQTDLENEGYEVFPCILPAASVNAPHKRERIFFIAYSNGYRNTPPKSGKSFKKKRGNRIEGKTKRRSRSKRVNGLPRFQRNVTNPKSERSRELRDESQTEGSQSGNELPRESYRVQNRNTANTNSTRQKKQHATTKSDNQRHIARSDNKNATNSDGKRRWYEEHGSFKKSRQPNKASEINDWENFPTQSPLCDGNDGLSSRLDGITFSKWRRESIAAGGNAIVPQVMLAIFKAIEAHINSF